MPRQGKPNDSTGDGKDRPAGYGETSKFGIEPSHLCMMGQSKRECLICHPSLPSRFKALTDLVFDGRPG